MNVKCEGCEKQKKADNCIGCGKRAMQARKKLMKSLSIINGSDFSGRISPIILDILDILDILKIEK